MDLTKDEITQLIKEESQKIDWGSLPSVGASKESDNEEILNTINHVKNQAAKLGSSTSELDTDISHLQGALDLLINKRLIQEYRDIEGMMSYLGRRPEYKLQALQAGKYYIVYVEKNEHLVCYNHKYSARPIFVLQPDGDYTLSSGHPIGVLFHTLKELKEKLEGFVKYKQSCMQRGD